MPDAPALESGAHQRILDALTSELGDALQGSLLERGDLWVRVDRAAWRQAIIHCKRALGLTWFGFLSGIDWEPAPGLSGEKAFRVEDAAAEDDADDAEVVDEPVAVERRTGAAGGESRFQVFCRLADPRRHVGVTLKADLPEDDPRLDSVADLYRGADWHERETWEMFGFEFDGHPGLRHLYLPGEFEGRPLRKDFPLLAREVKPWPGIVNVEAIPAHLDPKNKPAEPAPADAAPVEGAAVADADAANQARGVPTEDQALPTQSGEEAAAAGQAGPDADRAASGASAGQASAEVATGSQEAGDKDLAPGAATAPPDGTTDTTKEGGA